MFSRFFLIFTPCEKKTQKFEFFQKASQIRVFRKNQFFDKTLALHEKISHDRPNSRFRRRKCVLSVFLNKQTCFNIS